MKGVLLTLSDLLLKQLLFMWVQLLLVLQLILVDFKNPNAWWRRLLRRRCRRRIRRRTHVNDVYATLMMFL
jgi:hypothetical protein